MIGPGIEMGFRLDAKQFFFDQSYVKDRVEQATRKALSRFGAFVRTRAMQSIKRRKKRHTHSARGRPPFIHTDNFLKRIWFVYEPSRQNVVIGPVWLNRETPRGLTRLSGDTTVPEVLEYGGMADVEVRRWIGSGHRWTPWWAPLPNEARERRRARERGGQMRPTFEKRRRVKIAARPFMEPAFAEEQKKLPALWAGSVKR